mmetsp:Transcript_5791/g.17678  ORF Transcript_5791/g.17678 Transcript_5791/m.17678 type:complete len:284 (-) Transcript_5791:2749-3600(-)|eukprot:361377-Chlamydomonas_euryale.AAC.6
MQQHDIYAVHKRPMYHQQYSPATRDGMNASRCPSAATAQQHRYFVFQPSSSITLPDTHPASAASRCLPVTPPAPAASRCPSPVQSQQHRFVWRRPSCQHHRLARQAIRPPAPPPCRSAVQAQQRRHAALDPVRLRPGARQLHLAHKVCRVAGRGQRAAPLACLVQRAHVHQRAGIDVGRELGLEEHCRQRREQDLGRGLRELVAVGVERRRFQEHAAHEDAVLGPLVPRRAVVGDAAVAVHGVVEADEVDGDLVFARIILSRACEERLREEEAADPEHDGGPV